MLAVMSGGDTFIGPLNVNGEFSGDFVYDSSTSGSGDLFTLNYSNQLFTIYGDHFVPLPGTFSGGADTFNISGTLAGSPVSRLYLDAGNVFTATNYTGGGDIVNITAVPHVFSSSIFIYGDADQVRGGNLVGGNDDITTTGTTRIVVYGDATSLGFSYTGGSVDGGDDEITTGAANDTIYADIGQHYTGNLTGGEDTVNAGDGADSIYGDALTLDDTLLVTDSFSGGWDQLNGNAGDDLIRGDFRLLEAGTGITSITFGYDTIHGGDGNDQIWGDYEDDFGQLAANAGGNDILRGEAGDDIIFGNGGNDTLEGGADNDILDGGDGDDTVDGGVGLDSASYQSAKSAVTVSLAIQGTAQITGGAGSDTLTDIENLIGSDFNDVLSGLQSSLV